MRNRHLLFWLVVAIAAITLVSGLVQVFLPGFILRILGTECSPASLHLFWGWWGCSWRCSAARC